MFKLECILYSFPDAQNSPELHARWVENVKKNAPVGFAPRKGSRLCLEHFAEDMMEQVGQRMMLLPGAIPTIFQTAQVCTFICNQFSSTSVLIQNSNVREIVWYNAK